MAKINIIFGSTGGNTELVVEKVADILHSKGHQVYLNRGDLVNYETIEQEIKDSDLTILASPTYGHGVLQEEIAPVDKHLKTLKLPGQKFAVIGLGDSKYDRLYHIVSATILEETVKIMEGETVCEPLRINQEVMIKLDTKVADWANQLAEIIA